MKGKYISGNDKKTLTNYGVEDCKEECEKATGFKCRGFDYLASHRYCYLQEANRHTHVLSASASYEYYEMDFEGNCAATQNQPATVSHFHARNI